MEYLKEIVKKQIAGKILKAPHTFFFLDYDGTLTPIMPKPEMAKLSESTRKLLKKLARNPKFSIGIITGRKVEEIKSLVKIENIIYAGNHGLELEGPDFKYTHANAIGFQRILKEVIIHLQPFEKSFPGSFIEDKGITATYHYRLIDPKWIGFCRVEFMKTVSPWIDQNKIRITEAKKAMEIRPTFNWNKGSAVRWILLHEDPESLPLYIGDDRTDESAFKALNERGITIKVELDEKSDAQYYVRDIIEVEKFLAFLAFLEGSNSK